MLAFAIKLKAGFLAPPLPLSQTVRPDNRFRAVYRIDYGIVQRSQKITFQKQPPGALETPGGLFLLDRLAFFRANDPIGNRAQDGHGDNSLSTYFAFLIARAIAATCAGVEPQQPPTIRAPACM